MNLHPFRHPLDYLEWFRDQKTKTTKNKKYALQNPLIFFINYHFCLLSKRAFGLLAKFTNNAFLFKK